ncbi:hypothetical protein D3C77_729130 [compost metagenome]
MDDLQGRLPGQLTTDTVQVRHRNPHLMGQRLDAWLQTKLLLDQFIEALQIFTPAGHRQPLAMALQALTADPHHQQVDQ